MKRIVLEKIALFILTVSIIAGPLSLIVFPPRQVHAGWPTTVIADIWGIIKEVYDSLRYYWDKLEQKYRDLVVALVIQKMQDMIIAEIAGDSSGQSRYISDWKDFLQDMATEIAFNEAQQYVNDLTSGAIDLCSPLSAQLGSYLDVRIQGLSQYYSTNYSRLPFDCQFEDFKRNIAYTANFIERGGWISWDTAFSPSVNPYWISLMLEDEFIRTKEEEKERRQTQAIASQGYNDDKICSDPSVKTLGEQECSGASDVQTCVDDYVQKNCTQWEVITPGTSLASALADAVGANFEYASNVQSAVAAIANVLIAKIFEKGISGSRSSNAGNVTVDDGDLPPELRGITEARNRQEVADAKQGYEDTIYYIDNILDPLVNANIVRIEGFNQSCPDAIIEVDDGTRVSEYTISELYQTISIFKQTFDQAKSEAQTSLATISGLDYSDDTAVIAVINAYGAFVNKYKPIFAGSEQFKAGSQGELEIALEAIYEALSDFSC